MSNLTDWLKIGKRQSLPVPDLSLSEGEIQKHEALQKFQEKEDYLSARKRWRMGIGILFSFVVIFHIIACMLLFYWRVSDVVLGGIIGALTVEVIGLAAIICGHLFPKSS